MPSIISPETSALRRRLRVKLPGTVLIEPVVSMPQQTGLYRGLSLVFGGPGSGRHKGFGSLDKYRASGPPKPTTAEGKKAIDDYIKMVAPMSATAKLLQENGQHFDHSGEEVKAGQAKLCYMNSFQLAQSNPEKYAYAEGLAVPHTVGFPIDHAWVVDKGTNKVVDPTWKDGAAAYFGVKFKPDYVNKVAARSGMYGILSYTNPEIFQGKDKVEDWKASALEAGGPGSGRKPEYRTTPKDPDFTPQPSTFKQILHGGQSYVKWAQHPTEGMIYDLPSKQGRTHSDWFEQIGLPSSGSKYDSIPRGNITVNHFGKTVGVTSYTPHIPSDVEEQVRSAYPNLSSYTWTSRPGVGQINAVGTVILSKPDVQAYGTSEGAEHAWDTRGRGRKAQPVATPRARGVVPTIQQPAQPVTQGVTPATQEVALQPSNKLKQATPDSDISFEPSERMQRALENRVPCGKEKQRIADRMEQHLSDVLGIPRTADNKPFDLTNGKVGIEVKCMQDSKNAKVTMSKDALARKVAEVAKTGVKGYTVVADKRQGKTQYYVKEGFGSFRVGSMTPISLPDLKAMVRGGK